MNPSNEAGAHRSNSAKHDPGCGRAVGHAVQGHPHRNPVGRGADARCTRWLAPDACEQSRNHSHNSKKCLGTRAPRSNGTIGTGARAAAATSETQGHALPRAPSLLLSLDTLARRRPAAPAVGPRRRSRLSARALDRFATNMPAQTPSGARVAALQQARPASRPTAPPQSARPHTRCCMLGAPRAAHIEKSGPPARTAREASWPGANWWFLSY